MVIMTIVPPPETEPTKVSSHPYGYLLSAGVSA